MKKVILSTLLIVFCGSLAQAKSQVTSDLQKAKALLAQSGTGLSLEFFEDRIAKLQAQKNCCDRPADPLQNFLGVWYGEGTMDNPMGPQTHLAEFRAWLGANTYIVSVETRPNGEKNVIFMLTNNYQFSSTNPSFLTYQTTGTLGSAPGSGSCVTSTACQVSTVFREQNMLLNEVEVKVGPRDLQIYGEGRQIDTLQPVLNYGLYMKKLF